jgi:hypothetical protein
MVDVALYLRYAQVAQVKDFVKNQKNIFLKGGTTVQKYVRVLEIVRKSVQFMYDNNPSETTLDQVANYLLNLSGRRTLSPPAIVAPFEIIIQPQSQSADEGDDVIFTVQASGGIIPYVYQWYKNLTPMSGEESSILTLTNVDGSDQASYYCVVTDNNGAGTVLQSDDATLTINVSTIAVFYAVTDTDPFPLVSDPYTYTSQNIIPGANISWNLLNADQNKYFIFKEPITEPVKTIWVNTLLNQGIFPDSVYRAPVVLGSFRYYLSRITFAYDISQPMTLS